MGNLHGFELLQETEIPELNATARLYRHQKTRAELLSLRTEDENKCFGISFRTPPEDSTGVAHILEHSVLCGSRKYPLKDPFVELLKGSLQTFLNAFTFPDKTCYPVASTNLKDFYNLVDVYLDTVFYPRLDRETFLTQGWRYEALEESSQLSYKGVVFNEMKGAYSSPDAILGKYSQQSLFPDTPYGHNSGGDPKHILDLTYEGLLAFHREHYHPSNSRCFFYGDDPEEDRLRILNGYLQDFDYKESASQIPLQPHFSSPRSLTSVYAADEDETDQSRKSQFAVNWLLPENNDLDLTMGLSILSSALIGTPASPLRKALIDSGLGDALTGGGLEEDLRQMTWSVGLKGMAAKDIDRAESLIYQCLTVYAEQGIDPGAVQAAVNTLEFRLREQNTGSFPRGLSLMLHALTTWLHGGDPIEPLRFEGPLVRVKQQISEGDYLERLIRAYLLDNPHRTTVLSSPDATLAAREKEAEELRLAKEQAAMPSAQLRDILSDSVELSRRQNAPDPPEALASLPSLSAADLDRQSKTIPVAEEDWNGVVALTHDIFTSGIVYLDLVFDLRAVPQEHLPYLSLFSRSLLQMGTEKEDFVRLTQRIGQTTGGISPMIFFSSIRGSERAAAKLALRGKATGDHLPDLLALMSDIVSSPRLDNKERFLQLALEDRARLEASLVPGGSGYAAQRIGSRLTEAGGLGELTGGISYLFFLRELIGRIESDWAGVVSILQTLRSLVLRKQEMIINVTMNDSSLVPLRVALKDFAYSLPSYAAPEAAWRWDRTAKNEGLSIPAQVNYVCKAANLYNLGYSERGCASVISRYLATTWLWNKVRVQGGAYGGSCSFDPLTGIFTYSSYRDPNLLETLQVFDETPSFLRSQMIDAAELNRSVVGAIGAADRYQLPDAKGFTSLVRKIVGETDEVRQKRRDEIFAATPQDFLDFAEILVELQKQGQVAVLGSADALRGANEKIPGLLEISKAL